MTTTRTTPARDLTAGTVIIHRGYVRTVLSDASLDLDNDGNVWAYAVLEAVTGQPLNLSLPADEPVQLA
jgi:hypothetical protein